MYPQIFSFKTPEFLTGFLPDHITIHSYGFMIALGIMLSFWFMLKRVKKFGIDKDQLSSFFMWAILAGFVGGKLFFFLEDIDKYMAEPGKLLRLAGGGFVFYGSVIFVIPTLIIWLRKHHIPVRPFLDIVAFVGPIAQGFGRVGCFLAGCCHGKVCNNWMGVTFSNPKSLANPLNVPLYPTQLMDIGVNLIIFITLFWLEKRKKFAGQLMLVYMIMYAIGRSINELYRGDEERGFLFNGSLSHSQFIAIVIFVLCSIVWFRWKNLNENQLWFPTKSTTNQV
ncbi:MAG: prolipoprotein diacylglyceryl transferase [Flavobacteriales bacterium]|nr:prolipoprotein diacylglyceryl transferase [Flavobacteriales bacterium]